MIIIDILRQVPFFSHMTDSELERLHQNGHVLSLQAGEVAVREGDIGDCMYVVLDGQVSVHKNDDSRHAVTIATLSAGDFFGEMALLDAGPRSASVTCQARCSLFVLDQDAFRNLLAQADSGAVLRLFAALTRRVRDTTERVLREELARQTLEAETEIERHRSLAQMVAGVAHEINTPLGIINTAASVIANRMEVGSLQTLIGTDRRAASALEDIQEASDLIQGNIARAHKLVQDFKKISVNQLNDARETVNLSETLNSAVDLFRISARKAKLNISISDHLPEGERAWIGYPGVLVQVVMNLLTNVERYAYVPGVGGEIVIDLSGQDGDESPQFIMTVQDYGQGIAEENLPRVFEPFFTTGRSKGGTGLGMAIVYNIVTSVFGGQIEVTSEVNRGTTVTIIFPKTAPERT